MSGSDDEVPVGIPRAMFEQLERKILGTRFESVQGYVKALIEQVLSEATDGDRRHGLSAEDEFQIKEKLKALGYI